jgi:hypothetical protein
MVLIRIEEKMAERNQNLLLPALPKSKTFLKSNIKEDKTKKIPDMYIVNGSKKSMIMLIFSLSSP